ncbi:MAG: LacI family DNA-binding transcriptional regulator [Azospirillum sp.]|nr:LacI family DNA-binding transcriptional regulator [Azospirillum sp.]
MQLRKTRASFSSRTTMADVARDVGVSAITVSRALRTPETVSEALRTRIAEACDRLGYVPSRVASALASARSMTISVLIPSLSNIVFIDVIVGIKETLDRLGYQMLMGITGYDDPGAEERLLRRHLEFAPDGILLTGADQSEAVRALLKSFAVPSVHMMDDCAWPECWWVGFSNFDAGAAAGRHLLANGRRRVAIVAAQLDPRSVRRCDGCRAALVEAGCYDPALDLRLPQPSSIALGAEVTAGLVARNPECDGVFFCNDDLAHGALFWCGQQGIAVPQRLAMIGFHDLSASAWTPTPLTTVETPRARIGRDAALLLTRRIADPAMPPQHIDHGFQLIRRASA